MNDQACQIEEELNQITTPEERDMLFRALKKIISEGGWGFLEIKVKEGHLYRIESTATYIVNKKKIDEMDGKNE
jgi:hypothetical protein